LATPPRLIALYAPVMQSGKTEIARTLQLTRGYALVKFADPFKASVVEYLVRGGATQELAEQLVEDGNLKERVIPGLGVSVRQILQTFGSAGRAVHPDFWVRQAVSQIERHFQVGTPVVVDDMRFPNEYEALIDLGGYPVRVNRPGSLPYTAHPSEGLLEQYPMFRLDNAGSLGQLRNTAEHLPELLASAI